MQKISIEHSYHDCVFFWCPTPYGAVNQVLDKLVEACDQGTAETTVSWPEIGLRKYE